MAATDLIGRKLRESVFVVERGPVARFADGVLATSAVYKSPTAAKEAGFEGIPVPPTFTFAAPYWGAFAEDQPENDPDALDVVAVFAQLQADGGLNLHGEQEFRYHSPIYVGQRLHVSGVVEDVSIKQGKGGAVMTAVKCVTEVRHEDGTLAVTQIMTILNRKTPKA
jgi:acyl dehydratase